MTRLLERFIGVEVSSPPMHPWRFAIPILVIAAMVPSGCVDQEVTPPSLEKGTGEQSETQLTSYERLVDVEVMKDNLLHLTRAVALALADEDLRLRVYAALRESRVPERKLHFRALLASEDLGLLDTAIRRAGVSRDGFLAQVAGVPDLEFYLPVAEHREGWMGGTEVLVASALDDDGSTPFAFDLMGEPVALDPRVAPDIPVLALVPVETDYWAPGSNPIESVVARAMSSNPGIYMTFSEIGHDFEGWLMGEPEFEVHAFRRVDGEWVDVECAGEERSPPYHFNQDSQYAWHGEVLLLAEAPIDGDSIQFQVWENDWEACGTMSGRPPRTSTSVKLMMDTLQHPALEVKLEPPYTNPLLARITKVAHQIYEYASGAVLDDFVGVIEWPPVTCWPEESGGVWADIRHPLGVKYGYARLDDTYDGRTPLCSLGTTISGPSTITWCPDWFIPVPEALYDASVSGSSGTPGYQWWFDGDFVSTDAWYEIPNGDLSGGDHSLYVLATRGGEQASDSKSITVIIDCSGG